MNYIKPTITKVGNVLELVKGGKGNNIEYYTYCTGTPGTPSYSCTTLEQERA